MAPARLVGAMPTPIGFTRSGRPVWPISGAEDDGGTGAGDGGDKPDDQIDVEAAKAAMKVVEDMKAAGVDDPKAVLDTIKKLRPFEKGEKLPKSIQKELEELRGKAAAADKDKLSADEQTAQELADLKAQLADAETKGRTRALKAAVTAAAAKAGAVYVDDIPRLIDASDVDFDDDGNPTNADELVTELKKSRPALFGKAAAGGFDGGARGSGPPAKQDMETALRRAAGH